MIFVGGVGVLVYAAACIWLCIMWNRIRVQPSSKEYILPLDFKLSVIIPVRNEAANIHVLLSDLQVQYLPKKHFEVIVVDDASTDRTAEIVEDFGAKNDLDLKLIKLIDKPVNAPKKRAIAEGLAIATGQLIVTTDGDCRVGERWLETYAKTYLETQAHFISGPVTFVDEKNSFHCFQTIEFSSLIGTGACLLEAGFPTMCNGANLAYERKAFEAVGGYNGVDQIASGDDEFLLQKINQFYGGGVYFLKNQAAIVRTQPQESWKAFYQQRVRWGSKWAVNKRVATMVVAIFVFLVNTFTLLILTSTLIDNFQDKLINTILIVKFLPEFLFLSLIIRFLKKNRLIPCIPLVQLFYPMYVLLFGIVSQRKGYEWKGRKLK